MDQFEPDVNLDIADSVMNEDLTRATFENDGKTPFLARDISPSRKIDLLVVLLEMKVAMQKNEGLLKDEDLKKLVNDHIKEAYSGDMVVFECPAFLASSMNSAKHVLKNDGIEMNSFEFTLQSNGNIVIGVHEKDTEKLADLVRETYTIAKSFNTDLDVLKTAKSENGVIITTASRDLTTPQTYFMLPELSHAGLMYSVNPIDDKLSILINDNSDKAKLYDVIQKVSADMSSTDFSYWQKSFEQRAKTLSCVAKIIKEKEDTIYVSSPEQADGKYTFLKITPETMSFVSGTVPENEKEYDIKPLTDFKEVRAAILRFEKPVFLTASEFEKRDKSDMVKIRSSLSYGKSVQSESDKLMTEVLKRDSVRHINYRDRDLSKVWSEICDKLRDSENIEDNLLYDKIKDYSYDDYSVNLSRFCNAHQNLDKVLLASKEKEKVLEGDSRWSTTHHLKEMGL